MATTTQSPNDLTRQQLDELDDLLQRMLSLPLNPPESFSPTPPVQNYAPPMPTPPRHRLPHRWLARYRWPAPAPRVFAPPAPEPVESPFNFRPTPAHAPAPAPVSARNTSTRAAAPDGRAGVRVARGNRRPSADSRAGRPIPTPRAEPVPFLYAPFVAFNAVLNWILGLFGFPGRVLAFGLREGVVWARRDRTACLHRAQGGSDSWPGDTPARTSLAAALIGPAASPPI